jgi:hypothetical protein
MSEIIKISGHHERISIDIERGTGTFALLLSHTPSDDWRKLFDKTHWKDYTVALKTVEQPAIVEVTCEPGEVQEAAEAVKLALEKTNERLIEQTKKVERKAAERSKAAAQLEQKMLHELTLLKLE